MRFNVFLPSVFRMFILLAGVLGFFCSSVTRGAQTETASSAETLFRTGVDAYQKKDLAKARTSFTQAINASGETTLLLYNLGMVENRQGMKGLALGLWRKALATSPNFTPAKSAVEWAQSKLERPEIPHEVEIWENFRKSALVPVALDHLVFLTAFSLLAGGWLLLRHLGRRRAARLDEKPMPGFPAATAICLVAFLALGLWAIAKAFDSQTVRGTIVDKKIEARSSPNNEATPLFELYEGLEIIVRSKKEGWVQVTYPGASTGWVPEKAVFATNDPIRQIESAPQGKTVEK